MELTVPDMEDLGEPNKRVGDPAEHVDSSPASFKSLALNFPPSLPSPQSLLENRGLYLLQLVLTTGTLVPALSFHR